MNCEVKPHDTDRSIKRNSKNAVDQKRQILLELTEQLEQLEQSERADLNEKEKKFVNGLRQKGLIAEIPHRLPDDESRRSFKRIEVKGEPLSETIVKERG